ncbi:MAG: hypothetical protein AAF682_15405 [Planctomycetota bacterium]
MQKALLVVGALAVAGLAFFYFGSSYLLGHEEDRDPPDFAQEAFEDWPQEFDEQGLVNHSDFVPGVGIALRGKVGQAIDGESCLRVAAVLEKGDDAPGLTISKARLFWRVKHLGEAEYPDDWEESKPSAEVLTGGAGWVEALTLPQQPKVRLTYDWPFKGDWEWADRVQYRFEVEYWGLSDEPRTWTLGTREAVLACGKPPWTHAISWGGCECRGEPDDQRPELTWPPNGHVISSPPGSKLVSFAWTPVDWAASEEWEHAYLLEVWFGDEGDIDLADACFAEHYFSPTTSCVDVQPSNDTSLSVEVPVLPDYPEVEFGWRVRAQCCSKAGQLHFGEPSEIRTFTIVNGESPDPGGECCEDLLDSAPVLQETPDLVSSLPLLSWNAPPGMPADTVYQLELKASFAGWCSGSLDAPGAETNADNCWVRSIPGATQYQASQLESLGLPNMRSYEWRVRAWCPGAVDSTCHTPWSEVEQFFWE